MQRINQVFLDTFIEVPRAKRLVANCLDVLWLLGKASEVLL